MGNRSSNTANDWDSDEGGGSDYEHAYDFHTSVLHKSPADGFESDYEEDDDEADVRVGRGRKGLGALRLQFSNSQMAAVPSSVKLTDDGDNENKTQDTAIGSDLQNRSVSPESDAVVAERGSDPASRSAGQVNQADCSPQLPDTELKPRSRKQKAAVEDNSHTTNTAQSVKGQKPIDTQCSTSEKEEMEEETYETAGEGNGEGDEGGNVSDTGSLSTITPPRTRPESDSEYSVTPESETEESGGGDDAEEEQDEEENFSASDTSEHDTVAGNVHMRSTRSSAAAVQQKRGSPSKVFPRSAPRQATSKSVPTPQQHLAHRHEISHESYHQMRKRPATSGSGVPAKRSKLSSGIDFSPSRTRYGIFDTESESDTTNCQRRKRKRSATPPQPLQQRHLRETRSLSARTLRQAAKKAASQFVETSRKILRDAKTAALILKESTTLKRRSSVVDQEAKGASGGTRMSPVKRDTRSSRRAAELRREERLSQTDMLHREIARSPATSSRRATRLQREERLSQAADLHRETAGSPTTRKRREAVKRKSEAEEVAIGGRNSLQRVEDTSDFEMDDVTRNNDQSNPWRQVRKDGGRLRKFTRSATGTTSPSGNARQSLCPPSSQLSNVRSNSLPLLPAAGTAASAKVKVNTTPPGVSNHSINKSKSSPTASNPFQNITLIPSSTQLNSSTGSRDSISAELPPRPGVSQGRTLDTPSPFTSLAMSTRRVETPPPLTFTSGSVWARINTRRSHQAGKQIGILSAGQSALTPGSAGSRIATRSSPEGFSPLAAPTAYPVRCIPTAPSLTLTGQFAQSGHFAFQLENVLQVTVATGNITTATTSSIVISTDSQLRHQNRVAHSVAKAAGMEFTRACQDFLRRNNNGLQVCEILDTPAGGQLSPLISHVLHVVVAERNTQSGSDVSKHRKLLLCTYLNCLKHASEKLHLPSISFPLIGSDSYSTDECVQVFFDSLLIYLAERTATCPLHAIHLIVTNPATTRFIAEVLEARLETTRMSSIDTAMAAVFRDYFNIPDFSRNGSLFGVSPPASPPASTDRSPSGKPAVKRRRL